MATAVAPLASEIRAALKSRRDRERAEAAAAYMKVALPFLGVPVPEVRRLTRELAKATPLTSASQWRDCVQALFFDARHQEERYAACAVTALPKCRRFQTSRTLPLYQRMIRTAGWWDLVDDLSRRVGELRRQEPVSVGQQLRKWAKHPDLWVRRASIIAQRGDRDQLDAELLYDCIEPSLDDPDFFLRKGIGWALRDRAQTAPDEVRRYVEQNSARLSALSRREALKHLR